MAESTDQSGFIQGVRGGFDAADGDHCFVEFEEFGFGGVGCQGWERAVEVAGKSSLGELDFVDLKID